MTIEELPGKIVVPDRDTVAARFRRYHKLRVPGADTGIGSQPYADSLVIADVVAPLYAAAVTTGKNAVLEESRDAALDKWAEREGVPPRREAVGASGFVVVTASAGGGTVPGGDQLLHRDSGALFETVQTKTYANGDPAAVLGSTTGAATSLAAGTVLEWVSPRPGMGASVTVKADSSGNGLTGGRERENDQELQARIALTKKTPAASGNDAQYQAATEEILTVAVQKAFTYPAILGPGTTAVVFTLRPSHPGGSRAPNAVQIGLVESHVVPQMPADDGAFFPVLTEENADVSLGVSWKESAPGWSDVVRWPPFYATTPASGPSKIVVTGAGSSVSFTLATDNSDFTGVPQPKAGQTIAFYDQANFKFRNKRILSVAGVGPWAIVVDQSNNVSDVSYTPQVGQRASPWSESLDAVLAGVLSYFDGLGPGEQVAAFYDDGRRLARQPRPPSWPSEITVKGLVGAVTASEVTDVDPLEGQGTKPSMGTPGLLSYQLKLRWLSIFPRT